MSNISGVVINKGKIGANALANNDAISGLIMEAPAASGLALDTIAVVRNMKEVEALGIDADFDTNNFVNCFRHISEFFRMAGEGVKLYIMLVAQDTTAVTLLTDTVPGSNDAKAKSFLINADGEIRQLGICTNPTVAPITLNGFNDDTFNAIPLAQALHDFAYAQHMPCNVLLEGRDYSGVAATSQDLRNITGVNATKVSVVIGQDYDYAAALPLNDGALPTPNTVYLRKFADVGTALGTVSAAEINQNIGDNEAFNLTDTQLKVWETPGLSNNATIKSQFNDLQMLEDKGYIFGITYAGLEGVRWNNDHTCVPIIVDAQGNINEHTIAYGRTADKAVRLLRAAYLPKVKTKQPVDPVTGLLPPGVVKYFDGIGDTVFGNMVSDTEITAGQVSTDPNSDLLVAKSLDISYRIVPYGNVGEIIGTINLKTSQN